MPSVGAGDAMEHEHGPRSVLAHEVARRLISLPASASRKLSEAQAAKKTLDGLLEAKQIRESEYRQLLYPLDSLGGCDMDRCERAGDLAHEVARPLSLWRVFPDEELERLRGLL